MFEVIGAGIGFFCLYGVATVVGRIRATRYWYLRDDVRYVASTVSGYVLVGVAAVVGPTVYRLRPSVATAALAAGTVIVPLVLLVGQKYRRILGRFVYAKFDLVSGPPLKEAALDRILAAVPGTGRSGDRQDETSSDSSDGADDEGGSVVEGVASGVVLNVEEIVAAGATLLVGIAVAAPYLYLLLSDAPPLLFSAWALSGLVFGLSTAVNQTSTAAPGGERPDDGKNVVLLFVDDLRRDRLSLYGYDRETTPFLSSFDDAFVFENAIAPGTSSGHSIPAMLSGTFSTVHEYGHNLDLRYLPDAFESAGYETACISGNPHITADLFGDRFGWFLYVERGKKYLFEVQRVLTRILGAVNLRHLPVHYYILDSELMNQLAKRFLGDVEDRPFFLYLHYQDLHEPYVRELDHVDEFAREHGSSVERGDWVSNRDGNRSHWYDETVKNWGYDEKVRHTDECIEDVVAFLDERDLLDDTVVAVASDHGELLGERGMWGHPDLPYNVLFEVPLVVYDPDRDGGRVETPVSGVELPNVLLELANVEPDEAVTDQWSIERDVADLLSDDAAERPGLVDYFSNSINTKDYEPPLGAGTVESQRLLVDTEWKLYELNGERHLFRYDDAFLDEPVSPTDAGESTVGRMNDELDRLVDGLDDWSRTDQVEDPYDDVDDDRVRQQLKDLGYM